MLFFGNSGYRLRLLYNKLPPDVRGHSVRVGLYMGILFDEMLETQPKAYKSFEWAKRGNADISDFIVECGFYHDLGKIMVPRSILTKRTRLQPQEYALMQKHTLYIATLLTPYLKRASLPDQRFLSEVIKVGSAHHEHWDGSGYPYGRAEKSIPFFARICSIADAYDSITTSRVYSGARPHEEAVSEITTSAGAQFDPELVEIFSKCELQYAKLLASVH